MSLDQFLLLSPLVAISGAVIAMLLFAAFSRDHKAVFAITVCGFIAGIAGVAVSRMTGSGQVSALLIIDGFAQFYIGLVLGAGLVTAMLSYAYLCRFNSAKTEFYILLLLASLGGCVLAASSHFASFFLGLEILSVSLYCLIAYFRLESNSIEAGLKYLILTGISSALLLFGIAMVYAITGSLKFAGIADYLRLSSGVSNVLIAGFVLIMAGIGFKLALVPFHFWTPDIYEGSPAPVAGFIATVSKGAIFGLLLRLWITAGFIDAPAVSAIISVLAVASMFGGNLLALMQQNIKRILAYSSITHMGYLLITVLVSGKLAITAATFYLIAYFITMLSAFGVIGMLVKNNRDVETIDDIRSLAYEYPWLCWVFSAVLFSLAGIPLTAGFIGKFYIAIAGLDARLWALIIILAVNSALGLFYYLRIIAAMYQPKTDRHAIMVAPVSILSGIVLAALTLALIWLGLYPQPAIDAIMKIAALLS